MNQTIPRQLSKTIGPRIREARHLAGLTQRELANRLGVDTVQVSRWERGAQDPSLNRLEQIANALAVPVSSFFEEEPPLSEQQLELVVRRMIDELQDLLDRRSKPPREDQ